MSLLAPPAARPRHRAQWGVAAAGLTVAGLHAAPLVSSVALVRTQLWPRLAGLGRANHVALTFDDGPDAASTPYFLDALDAAGVQATFFLLGSMLQRYPQTGREVLARGHEIALHGQQHTSLLRSTPGMTLRDITAGRRAIVDILGTAPRFYRPPYGVLTSAGVLAARRHDLQIVLWSAWGRDWEQRATPESVVRRVTRDARGGGTVLLHDSDCTSAPGSWRRTLAALPALVRRWRDDGLSVGPLREHFEQ